jgi:hypothetical protein
MKALFFSLILIIIGITNTTAQTKTYTLKNERMGFSSKEFYIASVVYEGKNINFGRVYNTSQALTASFEGGSAQAVEGYIKRNFNQTRTDTLTPITLIIRELSVKERLTTPYRVVGDIVVDMIFVIVKNGQRVNLTGGKGSMSYERTTNDDEMIEKMVRNSITSQLKTFVKWFGQHGKTYGQLAKRYELIFVPETQLDSPDNDTVYYSYKRKLNWGDFRGPAKFGSRWAAQVFTSFGMELHTKTQNRTLKIYMKVRTFTDKTISWVHPANKNDYVLAHEQLHFDIAKLIAEQFKSYLKNMSLSVEDYSSEIQYQYIEFYKKLSKMQEEYDGETEHGLKKDEQKRWSDKVAASLKTFSQP